jgi:pimeloyl-ACP methyl ester carboxylesterase
MTGILLVHGAWHGRWCWDRFAEHLTARGHAVRAMQLRGHIKSPGRSWHRVYHYVADVSGAAEQFGTPPILVGHSLGGLVVQKYLERNAAPAAVLMAPIPVAGTLRAVMRLARRHPMEFLKANLSLRLRPLVTTPALVRQLFFTTHTAQEIVDDCFAHLQDESFLAFIDTMIVRVRPRSIRTRMLVLGAEHDAFFTVDEVRRTARAYGTDAEIFAGMGHNMMLDAGWPQVADRIDSWIQGQVRTSVCV